MNEQSFIKKLYDLIKEYNSLGINQQIDYEKFYLYSIITHSTAIEGSTLTEIENQLLFDEGIGSKKPILEQFMNLDLKVAYEKAFEYAERHSEITVELLCELSSLLMKNTGTVYKNISGTFSSAKGELRLLNVSAGRGGKSYISWQKVSQKLKEFCQWLNKERKNISVTDFYGIYKLSFKAHYNLVNIHPWADGNGRMSRLLMNMIQKEMKVIPSIVKKENRSEYIQSLAQSQEFENDKEFIDFMMNHHIENIEKQIEEYKQSIKNDTLNFENDTLNDNLNFTAKEEKILNLIKIDKNINTDKIVEKTGIARATVMRIIKNLKEKQILKRDGAKKNGSWILNI